MPKAKNKSFTVNHSLNNVAFLAEGSHKRAGVINFIVVKNFMCHSYLKVDFRTNISIITGVNGSGKSAIITALVLVLGGKANTTNRGTTIGSFVKAGKTSLTIEIELHNEGVMAYKPELYGSTINITRHITAKGHSTYKTRSTHGEIVSTEAKEIQKMRTALNLQIDNPICILNQDTSRNFLSSTNPKNRYQLFIKATQLDTLAAEYKNILTQKEQCSIILNEKQDQLTRLQDEVNVLEKNIRIHESLVSLKGRKELLYIESAWAKVQESELELEYGNSDVHKFDNKVKEFQEKQQDREGKLEGMKTDIRELERQIDELRIQIGMHKRSELEKKAELDDFLRKFSARHGEVKAIQNSIELNQRDITVLESDIENHNQNMTQVEQEKVKKMKDINALQEKLKIMDDHCETIKNDLFQLRNDQYRKDEEERDLRRELQQIKNELNDETKSMNALSGNTNDNLLIYGRDMPRVKALIAQCKMKFKEEPRGPLGAYIKLKDKKWGLAAEDYLSAGNLRTFCCDNANDSQLVREIFNKVWTSGRQPQIVTSKFIKEKHNVLRNLCQEPNECVCLYNILEIDDPVVSNCIVDICSPENVLLVPNDDVAMKLLSDKRNVPKNCRQALTMKGDSYFPDPNYRTYAAQIKKTQFLQVDTKEHLKQLKAKVENLKKKQEGVAQQLNTFLLEKETQEKRKNELQERLNKVKNKREQIRSMLNELNSAMEPEVQNAQFLERELAEAKKIFVEKTENLKKITDELLKIKPQINEKKQSLLQIQESIKELESRKNALTEEIDEKKCKQRELSTGDEFDQQQIKEWKSKLIEARCVVDTIQEKIKQLSRQAQSVGQRPDYKLKSVNEINQEVIGLKHRIESVETSTENINDMIATYEKLTQKFHNISELMSALEENLKEMNSSVKKRSKYYKYTENYFITYIKYSFSKILKCRQFEGTLEVDAENKQLELVVIPQHGSQGHTSTANLSGGERSFSTVSFLYSLWHCMEFPFYFLDEFDVYMDKLNRTKVVDILLHHARTKPHLQFVFFTPQDVSFINSHDKDVTILKLDDPQRTNI